MVAKTIALEGYGKIMINPVNFKEQDFETVDPTGNSVKRTTVGTRAKTVYLTGDGVEVPNNQLCKKIEVEGETIIAPKFKPSNEIDADNIEELEDNGLIYRALSRKFYNVTTDNPKIKDLVMKKNKSLQFPFCAGSGFKIWNAILTNWHGKIIMVCCIGDIEKELEKFNEDTVELEIEVIPQNKNMKKLIKVLTQ